jgi:hypothetical protein
VQHPHVDVRPELRKGQHPYIRAEFGEQPARQLPGDGLWA